MTNICNDIKSDMEHGTLSRSAECSSHMTNCNCQCNGKPFQETACSYCECNSGFATNILQDLIEWNPDSHKASRPSFFWRAHTISVLLIVALGLCYVALVEDQIADSEFNAKRGVLGCFAVFIAFGVTQARDGPFTRPHPVFWRFVLCCSVIYELCLIFLLFQTAEDARRWMSYFDPALGKVLPEQDYGGNCLIYDSANPFDPWHNVWDKCDIFVLGHFLGWLAKAVILRDYWITMWLSFIFEVLEYSLQHQLPNFSECWWDHWVLDFVICNGLGIHCGMLLCKYLEMKRYDWQNLWSIEGTTGKMLRVVQQFTPYRWRAFNWGATSSLKRWLFTVLLMLMFVLVDLNVFYLKKALWIPPPHRIIFWRLYLYAAMGAVAVRESYDYLTDRNCKRLGQQAWVIACIIITETLICFRFLWSTIIMPPPPHITIFWTVFASIVAAYTVWIFVRDFVLHHASQLSHVEDDQDLDKKQL